MGILGVTAGGLATAALVRQAFPSAHWATMIAIADAESDFNPGAVNATTGATGLWQIDPASNAWGPYIAQAYHITGFSAQQQWLKTPAHNAALAAHILAVQGLGAWQGDGYPAYLGLAQTLLSRTQTTAVAAAVVVKTAPTFGISGSARVTSGQRIIGRLTLRAVGGAIPYEVTMRVTPTYSTSYPTAATARGTIAANHTATVIQSLIAPLPAHAIILREQQLAGHDQITFPYTVTWTVIDPSTGQSRTVSAGQRVILTVG